MKKDDEPEEAEHKNPMQKFEQPPDVKPQPKLRVQKGTDNEQPPEPGGQAQGHREVLSDQLLSSDAVSDSESKSEFWEMTSASRLWCCMARCRFRSGLKYTAFLRTRVPGPRRRFPRLGASAGLSSPGM